MTKVKVRMMRSLTSTLRSHKPLLPLLAFVGIGVFGAMCYLVRMLTQHPDVSWNKSRNPSPNLTLPPTYQYKFYSPVRDYSKEAFPSDRPKID